MKKPKTNPYKIAGLVIVATVACLGALGGMIWLLAKDQADSGTTPGHKPAFSLETTKVPDWWTGGTRWPKLDHPSASATMPVNLPTADMTVHANSKSTEYLDNCFVSFSFYDQSVDPKIALTDKIKQTTNGTSPDKLVEIGTKNIDLNTATGAQSYQLHQFNFTANPDSQDVLRGMQFGFVPYKNGHIEVSSHCKSPESLSYTIPVLGAVTFTY